MSILGTRVIRTEDPRLLTAGGVYVDDVRTPELNGAALVTFVRSPLAHARITGIDASAAVAEPGVIAVLTVADMDDLAPPPPSSGEWDGSPAPLGGPWAEPLLAIDTVRFVGEPVAMVITDTRYQGEDAADLVTVDYEPLPVVLGPTAAVADETLLFPAAGTNVAIANPVPTDDAPFDACEVVVEQDIVNQRVACLPMEGRASAVCYENGKLTVWASSQNAQVSRFILAGALGMAPEQLRVVVPDVGGGLGAKFPRSLVSEIVGVGAALGARTSSRIDPLGIRRDVEVWKGEGGAWDVDPRGLKKAKKVRPSEINHGNITPSVVPLGVTIDYALNDRGLGLERARAAWVAMIAQAQAKGINVILLTPTPDQTANLDDPNDPSLRSFLDVALLVPGVSPTNTASSQLFAETSAVPGQGISVGSQRNFSNNFIVDGLSANDDAAGLSGVFYGLDSIEQLQVVTSGGQAELGRALGGYVNVVTKSGTNSFYGSANYSFQRPSFWANDFFLNRSGTPRPDFLFNRWGGSFSGPVRIPKVYNGKNKTFFLFGYEGIHDSRPRHDDTSNTVPTPAMHNGDFSARWEHERLHPFARETARARPETHFPGARADAQQHRRHPLPAEPGAPVAGDVRPGDGVVAQGPGDPQQRR